MSILLPENAVSIIRGTSKTLSLKVKDAAGLPVDLNQSTLYFTVKRKAKDKYSLIQKVSTDIAQIEIPNPTDGCAKIYITPEDTMSLGSARYVFDVLIVLPSTAVYVVVAPSVFEVKDGITVLNC
jgi:hypothetical protein